MKRIYQREVREALDRTKTITREILKEEDTVHLPEIVRKYLHFVGVVGREKVINFRAEFSGGIRSKSTDTFMPLKSVQYNFTDDPTRLFYIVARKKGIPAVGVHIYKNRNAMFRVKLAGLFTIADAKGPEMDQGETVTVFNDMCFMAPASLIDKNITWETVDDLTVRASFTNGSINIGAVLFFDKEGKLVNFLSNDRCETAGGKQYVRYTWLTPVLGYKEINGYRLPSGAKLIYKHPDEDFCYGEFYLVSIEYNCRELK